MKIIVLICGMMLSLSRYVYAEDIVPFLIDRTGSFLEIDMERQRTERYLAASDVEEVRKRDFYKENLGLSFLGSVYHRNLMNFDLDVQLGLSQQREESGTGNSWDTSSLKSLRCATNWLKRKPYAFSLFVDKRGFTRNYEFFERTRVEKTSVGGRGRWANKVVPIYYSLEKTETEERRTKRDSSNSEFIFDFGGNKTSAGGNSRSRLDYTYHDFERLTAGIYEQKGERHNLRFSNDFIFGKEAAGKRLSSHLYYQTLRGIRDMDDLNFSEDLELKHSPNLTSRYRYNFSRSDSQALKTTTQEGRFQIRHQLYKSLTTTFNAHGYRTGATNYDENSFGPGMDLLYRKNIKVGFLTLSYNLTNDFKERETYSQIILILDENRTLTDGVVTLLNNPNIDIDSIVVTDDTGTVLYALNIDYTISPVGSYMQIARIATGSIPNGSTVLVDYTTSGSPSFDYTMLRQSSGLRTDFFKGRLSLYYRFLSQRYPQSEEAENIILDTVKDNMMGTSFNFLPFYGSIEYEEYDSSISPYDTLRLRQGLSLSLARRSTLSLQSSQNFTRMENDDEKQEFYDYIAQYRAPLNPSTFFNMSGGFRSQSGANIDLALWTVRTYIEFNRGFLSFKIGYEFENENSWGDLRKDQYFYTEWKRKF